MLSWHKWCGKKKTRRRVVAQHTEIARKKLGGRWTRHTNAHFFFFAKARITNYATSPLAQRPFECASERDQVHGKPWTARARALKYEARLKYMSRMLDWHRVATPPALCPHLDSPYMLSRVVRVVVRRKNSRIYKHPLAQKSIYNFRIFRVYVYVSVCVCFLLRIKRDRTKRETNSQTNRVARNWHRQPSARKYFW